MATSQESDSQSHPFHWHFAELEDHDFEIRGRTLYYIVALFAIVLVVSLLLIYWRCFCRCRSNTSTSNSNLHAPTPPPPQPRGLDPATILALPISLVTNRQRPETDCSICLGVFGEGDKVKVLPQCQHSYHSECVDKWLSNESSCPLCRSSIQVDSDLHPPQIVTQ